MVSQFGMTAGMCKDAFSSFEKNHGSDCGLSIKFFHAIFNEYGKQIDRGMFGGKIVPSVDGKSLSIMFDFPEFFEYENSRNLRDRYMDWVDGSSVVNACIVLAHELNHAKDYYLAINGDARRAMEFLVAWENPVFYGLKRETYLQSERYYRANFELRSELAAMNDAPGILHEMTGLDAEECKAAVAECMRQKYVWLEEASYKKCIEDLGLSENEARRRSALVNPVGIKKDDDYLAIVDKFKKEIAADKACAYDLSEYGHPIAQNDAVMQFLRAGNHEGDGCPLSAAEEYLKDSFLPAAVMEKDKDSVQPCWKQWMGPMAYFTFLARGDRGFSVVKDWLDENFDPDWIAEYDENIEDFEAEAKEWDLEHRSECGFAYLSADEDKKKSRFRMFLEKIPGLADASADAPLDYVCNVGLDRL